MKPHAQYEAAFAEADQTDSVVRTAWYACTDNRRKAFGLRYRGYVNAGLIEPSPFEIYTDAYDDLGTTLVAALYRRGACIATLRISLYVPGTDGPALPCENVYPEVAALKANAQGPIVELSRLSIDPEITNTRYRARLYAAAIRAGIMGCVALDARHLIAATQTKWQSFYEHVLDFKVAGAAQLYPPGDVPVILLTRELDADLRRRMARNMFFRIDKAELDELCQRLPGMVGLNPAIQG